MVNIMSVLNEKRFKTARLFIVKIRRPIYSQLDAHPIRSYKNLVAPIAPVAPIDPVAPINPVEIV